MRINMDEKIVVTKEDTEKALFNTGGTLGAQMELTECVESKGFDDCSQCPLGGQADPCEVGRRVTFIVAAEFQRLARLVRKICLANYSTAAELERGLHIIAEICYANTSFCDAEGGVSRATINDLLEYLEEPVHMAKNIQGATASSN